MKKVRPEVKTDGWLATFADTMTLLMTFFIMLFTTSSVETDKFEQLVETFKNDSGETSQIVLAADGEGENIAGGATGLAEVEGVAPMDINKLPENMDELYEYMKQYVAEEGLEAAIEVIKDGENVYLRLKDNLFFDPNMSDLKDSSYAILDHIGIAVKNMEDKIDLMHINGHTASVENYDVRIDRTLSSQRANSVLVFFEEQKQIMPTKLVSVGWGRNYPIAPNDSEANKVKNRRVDILIIGAGSEKSDLEEIKNVIGSEFSETGLLPT